MNEELKNRIEQEAEDYAIKMAWINKEQIDSQLFYEYIAKTSFRAGVTSHIIRAITAEQENERLRAALNNIVKPISYLQNKAKEEGALLDGMMAHQLSQSASFLQTLAKEALSFKPISDEIINNYKDYWEQVKEAHIGNGWISIYKKDWGDIIPKISKTELQHSGMFWRLNSLRHLPDLEITFK